ncbi:hypothetical protein HMN09_01086800 [Mycena chlorophos]|uniref:Uncharacterized protein n=1 Tax=Mycena chlorophos TaxID=658473 RepID=A0A8H6SC34_MYCCL|nr:hypothetical protein HMN09_01086800 [Mycena chlorophos]
MQRQSSRPTVLSTRNSSSSSSSEQLPAAPRIAVIPLPDDDDDVPPSNEPPRADSLADAIPISLPINLKQLFKRDKLAAGVVNNVIAGNEIILVHRRETFDSNPHTPALLELVVNDERGTFAHAMVRQLADIVRAPLDVNLFRGLSSARQTAVRAHFIAQAPSVVEGEERWKAFLQGQTGTVPAELGPTGENLLEGNCFLWELAKKEVGSGKRWVLLVDVPGAL